MAGSNRVVASIYEGVKIAADAAKFVASGTAATAMGATAGAAGAFALATGRTPEEAAGVVDAVKGAAYQPTFTSDLAKQLGDAAAPALKSAAVGNERMRKNTKDYWVAKAGPLAGVAALAAVDAGAAILDVVSPGSIGAVASGPGKTKIVAGTSGVDTETMLKFVKMEDAGANPVETAKAMGMWRGRDGIIRTWVDDRGAELTIEKKVLQRGETIEDIHGKYASLGEVLDHPELYKRYPGMESISVRFEYVKKEDIAKADAHAWYDPVHREITVRVFEGDENLDTLKSVLHEAQHDVQMIESMTGGTSQRGEIRKFNQAGLKSQYEGLREFWKEASMSGDPEAVETAERLFVAFSPEGRYARNVGEREASVTEWAVASGQKPDDASVAAATRIMQEDALYDKGSTYSKRDFLEENPILWGDEAAIRYVTSDPKIIKEFVSREKKPLDYDEEL